MNRRDALKTIIAAALLPSWQVPKARRPRVDLQTFCASESGRYDMTSPFVQDGHLYATDGQCAVRVPTTQSDVLQSELRLPPASKLGQWNAKGWAKAGPGRVLMIDEECPDPGCCGGEMICKKCDGEGFAVSFEADPHNFERCHYCRGKGITKTPCQACGGKGHFPQPCLVHVKAGTLDVYLDNALYSKFAAIEGVQCMVMDQESPASFRFDGGEGLLMPLHPKSEWIRKASA